MSYKENIGIYKITNKVNGKIYIGQSIAIQRRWQEHINDESTSLIHRAIVKYGIDNFTFEVIEYCTIDQLNTLEIKYIQQYNSLVPNGYNVSNGGQNSHETFAYIEKDVVDNIINDLLNTQDSIYIIAQRYNVSHGCVNDIRTGATHYRDNLHYPLRDRLTTQAPPKYCPQCGRIIDRNSKLCTECHNKSMRVVQRPEPLELARLIYTHGFRGTSQLFGVSDGAIKKWCKTYKMPYLLKEVKAWYLQHMGDCCNESKPPLQDGGDGL